MQQQQKLLERRKKKELANKQAQAKKEESKANFGVNDELDLTLAAPVDQGFGYVSEELVDHLNDQIRQIKDENGRLYKLLNEKDFEIRQIKKKFDDNRNSSIEGHVTNETAATRIIELSRKVREQTAEKEKEKTKVKQLQKKCHDLQVQLQSCTPSDQTSTVGSVVSLRTQDDAREDNGSEVKALQDRLKQSESRLTDLRNQSQQLRQELKVAHKVLSQEIGENVNIQSLLNETTNWRGRAQQIIALQQKVDELKVQLESSNGEIQSERGDKVSTARRRKEEKYREELRRIEREKKEAAESATSRLKSLESEHGIVKEKLEASKARIKVLSNENKGQKAQVQTLLKKSRNDDEFVEALLKQQTHLKSLLEEHSSQQAQQASQQAAQLQQMSMKSQHDNNIVEQLKAIAAQKEAQVKMLEMELQHLRVSYTQNQTGNGAVPLTPQSTMTPQSATVDHRPISESETLTGRSQSAMSSARSLSSRASGRATQIISVHQHSGQDPGIPESMYQELQQACQESEMLRRSTEVERDKMTELVQVLQTRLAEETKRLAECQAELQSQKRAAVDLEKRLARQNMDSVRKSTARGKPAMDAGDTGSDDETVEKNELLTRLEIQKDENESLKTALQRTLHAKNEDLKVYSSTLDETKKVFLEALRQMKGKQAAS